MTISAAVIGLGNIGMLYDYHDSSGRVLTHCSAYQSHSGFTLAAGVDPDANKREMFTARYHKPAYASLAQMLDAMKPEVLSLALPYTEQHSCFFNVIGQYRPRAVILEKPLAASYQEAQAIVSRLTEQYSIAAVNYIRRYEPGTRHMVRLLQAGEIGQIQHISAWFTKGMESNGCHIIDLLHFIFCNDATLVAGDNFGEINAKIAGVPCTLYKEPVESERFEILFSGTTGKMHYRNSGRAIFLERDNGQTYPVKSDFDRYQWHVQDALYDTLTRSSPLPSTPFTALPTERFIQQLHAVQRSLA